MLLRLTGAIVLLAGIAVAGFAAFGLVDTDSMARSFSSGATTQNVAFDAAAWSARWRLWSVSLIAVGLVTSAAGLAMAFNFPWGLILLSAATACAALFPWVLRISGSARYTFEAASVRESLLLATIAITALLAFFLSGRKRD